MIRLYDSLLKGIRSFIAPRYCGYCRRELYKAEALCSSCLLLIQPILSTRVPLSSDAVLQVYALSAYEEPLKTLVLAKNRSHYEFSRHLGTLMWRDSIIQSMQADYLFQYHCIPLEKLSVVIIKRGLLPIG